MLRSDMAQKLMRIFFAFLLMLAPTFAQAPDEVTPVLNQGASLIHAGQLVQAQDLFEKALRRFPGNADLSFDLGTVYFLQHKWPKAIENYQTSLLAKPDQVDALYYMAQAYYQNSDFAHARETIAHAAALAPGNADVCQKYGEYLVSSKDKDRSGEGLKWLKKARSLNPNLKRIDYDLGVAGLSLKDYPSAAASFEAELKKDPANGRDAFLVAESRSLTGEWEKARDNYNYAISHGYSSASAYLGLGRSLVQLGSNEAAIPALRHALALQPSLAKAHFLLSKAYRQVGRLDQAKRETKIFGQMQVFAPDKVTPLLTQGEGLATAGQLVQAQEFFENALRKFPGNPDLLFNLGMAFFLQHDWSKAIENYKKSLLAKPNQVDPLYYMAQAYVQNSDLRLARETIARAAALAPDNPDVCQKYGEYLAASKETREEGLKWLQKARTMNPFLDRIDFDIGLTDLYLKDFQGARVTFQAVLEKDPANGEAAFLVAESWSALGDWGKAQDNYNYALSHGYSSGPAYFGLGTALVQLGSYEAALAPLQRALDLQPSLVDAHLQLSKAYSQLGRLEDARRETKLYEEMKAKGSDAVPSLLTQGEALIHAGQLIPAQELFEKALLRFPDNPDLSFDLGMAFFLQHNWPKAIENYKKSLLIKPDQGDPLFYMAQAYYQSSEPNLAIEAIARAVELAPDNPDYCQEYGEYLAENMDKRLDGLKWLKKAQSLNPNLDRIDFDIGMAQFNLNDLRSAAASFQAVLKKDPANGEAAFYLGDSLSGIGDWEEARDSYNYALSHGTSSAFAYYGLGAALVQLGSYEAALAPLKNALELDPSLKKAHFQLSKAYRQLGRVEEAQREAKLFEVLDQAGSSSSTYAEFQAATQTPAWAHVKALLEENKEQEALDYVAKLPSRVQNNAQSLNPGPYYLLGVVYHTMGRMDDAKRVLAIARAKTPTNAQIPAYLGVVQLSTGEVDQAEKSCDTALALDPTNELALIVLAHIRYKQQRWEDVIAYLERSHTANPGALYMLCDAYFRVGKTSQAIFTAEAIRTLAADNRGLLDDLDQLVKLHQADQPVSASKADQPVSAPN